MHRLTAAVMTVAIVLAAAVCPIAGRTPSSEFTIGVSDLLDISVYGVADWERSKWPDSRRWKPNSVWPPCSIPTMSRIPRSR